MEKRHSTSKLKVGGLSMKTSSGIQATKSSQTRRTSRTSRNQTCSGTSLTLAETATSAFAMVKTVRTKSIDDACLESTLNKLGYLVDSLIDQGGFASVYRVKAQSDPSGQLLACKVFDLTSPNLNKQWMNKCLKNEMYVSNNLHHPNIVLTHKTQKTKHFGFIVMTLAPNGNMKNDIYERREGKPYTEDEARKYFTGLMNGLNCMHQYNVAHRDLKLENFLFTDKWIPMLSDFGFVAFNSDRLRKNSVELTQLLRQTQCGTVGYMAPELLKLAGNYDAKAVDIFAMGVCLFEMVNAQRPYPQDLKSEKLDALMLQGNIRYTRIMSNTYRQLVSQMLSYQPSARPSSAEVLKKPWISNTLLNMFANL